MAVRPGMVNLVDRLRSITAAATNEEVANLVFWSDEQIQYELDRVSFNKKLKLNPNPENPTTRFHFTLPAGTWIEETLVFVTGDGLPYSASHTSKITEYQSTVTFEDPVSHTQLYLNANLFDWNAAAANIWGQKASHRAYLVDMKFGDHTFSAGDEYERCIERMRYHKDRALKRTNVRPRYVTPIRSGLFK